MDKKTQMKFTIAGWLVSVAVLGVIDHFQRKKRLREERELAKTTNDFAEKLVNGMTEELMKKKIDERFKEEADAE